MTFSELVLEVSVHSDLPKTQVARTLRAFTTVAKDVVLALDEKIVIPKFGVFYPYAPSKKELFGGSRKSGGRRRIRFQQSRSA